MEEDKTGFSHFSGTPTSLELRVMHFIEYCFLPVRKHPIANAVITIIFFLMLYLNTIVTLVIKEPSIHVDDMSANILCFLVSFTIRDPSIDEIRLGLVFVSSTVFLVFLISIMAFSFSYAYKYIVVDAFAICVLYFLPIIFTFAINIFQHSYIKIDNIGWYTINYISVFAHYGFTFLVTMTSLFSFLSPYIGLHPFFQRDLICESVTLFYYLIIIHVDSYYYTTDAPTNIIRLIVSFGVAIFTVFIPPFYNRHITALFFSYTVFTFSTAISILIKPSMQLYCTYYIFIGMFLSILIYYIILPCYFKRLFPGKIIFYEFFFGHYDKVVEMLDRLTDPNEVDQSILSNVINIAFHLDSPSLMMLFSHYTANKKLNVGEMLHMWMISHLYHSSQGMRTPALSNLISVTEHNINALEKEFWNTAWLSDITYLPIIAGNIGRQKMGYYLLSTDYKNMYTFLFPSLLKQEYANQIISANQISSTNQLNFNNQITSTNQNDPISSIDQITTNDRVHFERNNPINFETVYFKHIAEECKEDEIIKSKWRLYIGPFEIFLVFTAILYFLFQLMSLLDLLKQKRQGGAFNDFLDFTYEFYRYHLQDHFLKIPPNQLYFLFNKAVTTDLPKIRKYLVDSGFKDEFNLYYQDLTRDLNHFPTESFLRFVKKFDDTLHNFTSVFELVVGTKLKSLLINSDSFFCLTIVGSFILLTVTTLILRNKMIKFYEKFRYIPKDKVVQIGQIKPQQRPFEKYWISRSFSVCASFPLTFSLGVVYFAISILFIGVVFDSKKFNKECLESDRLEVLVNANTQRIPLNLVAAVFQEGSDEAINTAQFYANDFLSDPDIHNLIIQFPQSFYNLIGKVMFDPEVNLTITPDETYQVVLQIWNVTSNMAIVAQYKTIFHIQRFMTYVVLMIIVVALYFSVVWKIKPIAHFEQKMGQIMLNKMKPRSHLKEPDNFVESDYINDDDDDDETITNDDDNDNDDEIEFDEFSESSISIESKKAKKWSIDEIPIIIIVIDQSFKLRYQTNVAKALTNLNTGDDFHKANFNITVMNDITETFSKIEREPSSSSTIQPISIPFDNNQKSLIISPYYQDDQRLDHVLIVGSNEPPNASIETFNKYSRTFYAIYPRFLPLSQKFPYEIQSNQRPFFLLFFKLLGFNEWCDRTDLNVVDKFRRDVSRCCDALLQSESNFCRVRESSDLIIMMMNRETKLSIWKILEVCSDFGNNVLQVIQRLANEYNANDGSIRGCALLFKVKEPNYFFTARKCGRTDFRGGEGDGVAFAGEARFVNCKPDIVNYTSQKKELKVSNTTKLKTCHTPDGEEYELLIVV